MMLWFNDKEFWAKGHIIHHLIDSVNVKYNRNRNSTWCVGVEQETLKELDM